MLAFSSVVHLNSPNKQETEMLIALLLFLLSIGEVFNYESVLTILNAILVDIKTNV